MFPSILPLLIRPDKRLRNVVLPAPLKKEGKENEKGKEEKTEERIEEVPEGPRIATSLPGLLKEIYVRYRKEMSMKYEEYTYRKWPDIG